MNNKESNCEICQEKIIHFDYVKCFECKSILHNNCESLYRDKKGYCECPNCHKIGTIYTTSINYEKK